MRLEALEKRLPLVGILGRSDLVRVPAPSSPFWECMRKRVPRNAKHSIRDQNKQARRKERTL
jgi:hypothetical protein